MIVKKVSLFQRCIGGVLILGAIGCSRPEVELGNVQGTITLDGKALPNAVVRFVPVAGGRSAIGRTDDHGHYKMAYSATATGAIVGKVRVEITTNEENQGQVKRKGGGGDLVPARYNINSELFANVERQANELDFDLDSKK